MNCKRESHDDKNIEGLFRYFKNNEKYYLDADDIEKFHLSLNKADIIRQENKMLQVHEHTIEMLVKDLLVNRRITVEEYENGALAKIGYPGNWNHFIDVCMGDKVFPSICALRIRKNEVDCSFLRTSENVIYTCCFEDDDVYSHLHSLITEINAYEIIYDENKLGEVCNSFGILTHLYKKCDTSSDILKQFLKVEDILVTAYKRPDICILDDNILESLNIYSETEKCVMSTFECRTVQGRRLLLLFMKQPLKNEQEILHRLSIVEALRSVDLSILNEFPDLLKVTRKILNMKVSSGEILKLYQVVNKIPDLIQAVNTVTLQTDFCVPLSNCYNNLKGVIGEIENVIDIKMSDHLHVKYKCGSIGELNTILDGINHSMLLEYKRILAICDKVKYEESQNTFRITRTDYRIYESTLKANNVLVTSVLKAGVNFTTKTLSELVLEKENTLKCISKETSSIMNELKTNMKKHVIELELLNYIVALLDVFGTFSVKCNNRNYCRPTFGSKLMIKNGFHPLLEDNDCIRNDIELDKNRMCIITGPNMGGKSTFLRTVGVIGILAQVGCYVPAEHAVIPIFDGVYIRIGANDCTYTNSSTFMMEMRDIARICRVSTENSLVLIDELGRGTSELDGLSIAMAVKDYLRDIGCYTVFATHLSTLCCENSVNKRALSDDLVLLYKIVDGVCDKSFGLNVAKKVGFPDSVIDDIVNQM